jgi:hypothetical protein
MSWFPKISVFGVFLKILLNLFAFLKLIEFLDVVKDKFIPNFGNLSLYIINNFVEIIFEGG